MPLCYVVSFVCASSIRIGVVLGQFLPEATHQSRFVVVQPGIARDTEMGLVKMDDTRRLHILCLLGCTVGDDFCFWSFPAQHACIASVHPRTCPKRGPACARWSCCRSILRLQLTCLCIWILSSVALYDLADIVHKRAFYWLAWSHGAPWLRNLAASAVVTTAWSGLLWSFSFECSQLEIRCLSLGQWIVVYVLLCWIHLSFLLKTWDHSVGK